MTWLNLKVLRIHQKWNQYDDVNSWKKNSRMHLDNIQLVVNIMHIKLGFFSYRTRPKKRGTVPASANTGSTCSTRVNGTPSRWKAIFRETWKTSKVSSSRASFPPQNTASRWVFPMDRKCPALSRKRNASSHYKQVNAIETRSSLWFNRSVSFCLILYRIDDFFHGNPNYS